MHIAILKSSNDPSNALHRLQSTPLHHGLEQLGVRTTQVMLDGAVGSIAPPTHIVVHYFDKKALAVAVDVRNQVRAKIVVLCSDIYDLATIRKFASQADLLLVPTRLHRDLMQSAVMTPVRVLPEAVDPIALPGEGPVLPPAIDNNICWFGYPESFAKSMRYLLPDALKASGFPAKRLCVLTAPGAELLSGLRHKSFTPESFYAETAEYSHALLSHFVHDHHINTFIKSPNKLVTSLVRGMVPLASATPSYLEIARSYHLEKLLFTGPADLARQLKTLDAERDRQAYGLAAIGQDLQKTFSPEATARRFLELVS